MDRDEVIASNKDYYQAEANEMLAHSLIDYFSRTNVYLFYITYTSLIIFFSFQSWIKHSWLSSMVGLLIGMVLWTLVEYLIHRFLFHWQARSKFEKILVFIFHHVHHAYPKEVARSITPLIFSLPLALLFYFALNSLFQSHITPIFTGFLMGYVLYIIIHDSTHHFALNFPIFKHLKRNHMAHHYFNQTKNFGVSTPLWDYIFKTFATKTI